MKACEYGHLVCAFDKGKFGAHVFIYSLDSQGCVSILLNAGASVNFREWEGENTALHLAVKKGHKDVVNMLVSQFFGRTHKVVLKQLM